jgi:hypothetical protein
MAGEKAFEEEKKIAERIACGRSFDEQVDSIKRYGLIGVSQVLRDDVLAAHGICKPKDKATNGIQLGKL